jgi:PleD family two-component response regulator
MEPRVLGRYALYDPIASGVTASLGVACSALFEKGSLTVSAIVTAADDALYRAKHEGRNRVCAVTRGPDPETRAH